MRNLIACAGLLSLALLVPSPASAQEVTCKDGATSHAGRGACSHHGGIARAQALPAGQPSAQPPPAAAAPLTAPSAPPASVGAPAVSAQRVACKDGTLSYAGRGACSHHGGVAVPSAATTAPAPATARATRLPQPLPQKADAATAKCKDGTLSYAKHHSGACSHHGGVARWLM